MRFVIRSLVASSFFVAVMLAVPAVTQAGACFEDTCDQAVTHLRSHRIIDGYPDGLYRPAFPINRAEFLKIAIGANYSENNWENCDPRTTYSFPDAAWDAWYSPYLCAAVRDGVISGYPDGTFKPAEMINLAEAAKIATELDLLKNYRRHLADMESVWFDPYVRYLAEYHAIPTSFTGPYEYVNRGQMANIIYPLYADITNLPSLSYEQIMGKTALPTASVLPSIVAIQETVSTTKDEYCGAFAGEQHYAGTYRIEHQNAGLTLNGTFEFDEGTMHDKKLHMLETRMSGDHVFYAFTQYASCNGEMMYLFHGLKGEPINLEPLRFCESSDDLDCAVSVPIMNEWPMVSDLAMMTKTYSNGTGMFTHVEWVYDIDRGRMVKYSSEERQD